MPEMCVVSETVADDCRVVRCSIECRAMPKATECLLSVQTALELRNLLNPPGKKTKVSFLCKHCKRPVRPEAVSTAGAAHFEHIQRNLDCPLSDKRTARKLYAAHKANK